MDPTECERLLAEARNGNVAAMDELLDAVRNQLCAAAQVQLDSKVRQRVGLSSCPPSSIVRMVCCPFWRPFYSWSF